MIDNQSLQAYCRHRAGIDADTAVDAAIGVHFCLATDHADRAARAFADATLAPGAFILVDFGRHPQTLSKNDLKPLYKRTRNHNASSSDYNRKFINSRQKCFEKPPSRRKLHYLRYLRSPPRTGFPPDRTISPVLSSLSTAAGIRPHRPGRCPAFPHLINRQSSKVNSAASHHNHG
mgnify:CR=1 FL=1